MQVRGGFGRGKGDPARVWRLARVLYAVAVGCMLGAFVLDSISQFLVTMFAATLCSAMMMHARFDATRGPRP